MKDITLEQLLEAGCHFGHKAERWHPKAAEFIWQKKDGIHIIDLVKTKETLDAAIQCIYETAANGGAVLFLGSKRQARGVVKEAAQASGASYLVQRWIGGFLTNWDSVHKNIQKIIKMKTDQETGAWKKFPKHEQTKLARYLGRLNVDYEGVLTLSALPQIVVIVDVKKEYAAVREAMRTNIPIIGIVDTNADPSSIAYPIPANDDAVGSVQLIVSALGEAYKEGREKAEKEAVKENEKKVENSEQDEKKEKKTKKKSVKENEAENKKREGVS